MQLTLRKRFTAGYQFDLNYTWSKSMDLTSIWGGRSAGAEGYSTWIVTNPWDRESQRAVSDYDMRHQWNAAIMDALVGGWQLSGLFRLTSGMPISVLNVRGWPNGWCCPHYGEVIAPVPPQTNNHNAPLIGGGSGPNLFDDPLTALSSFGPANVGPTSNLTNSVRFRPDLFGTAALEDPGSSGNYNTVMTPARVLQFGLRYEF